MQDSLVLSFVSVSGLILFFIMKWIWGGILRYAAIPFGGIVLSVGVFLVHPYVGVVFGVLFIMAALSVAGYFRPGRFSTIAYVLVATTALLSWMNLQSWETRVSTCVFSGLNSVKVAPTLKAVLYGLWSFSDYWPAVLTSIVFLSWMSTAYSREYPWTWKERLLRTFEHRWGYPLIALVLAGALSAGLIRNETLRLVAVNSALFALTPYVLLGVLILMRVFHRQGMMVVLGGLTLTIIFSGKYFLIPLLFLFGVGISDIWMRYYDNRNKRMDMKRRN